MASRSPVSDRWAVATVPAVLLLAKEGLLEEAADYLREILVWLGQRYGVGIGLADTAATPENEVRQVIGRVVPQSNLQRRDESYLAAVLLDLLAFLRLDRLYAFTRGELRRVNALPFFVATDDSKGQYLLDGTGVAIERNARYAELIASDWTTVAPHLPNAASPRYLQAVGRSWDHLAVSAVVRDRHFICGWSSS
jgi:hypothetical protein